MYRIKLASGAETTFQGIDELTAALRDGTVTAAALIYHQRAERWLTIINHPHYQIALSRAAEPKAGAEASKRQVISAVRSPEPGVAPRSASPNGAGAATATPRKLTIPTPRKTESGELRAQENVIEGVVVPKPKPAAPADNGQLNGSGAPSRTTVLPIRSAPANGKPKSPSTSPIPNVPDLGDGLDLVDTLPEKPEPKRATIATPQVDKLLEMLEPEPEKVAAPIPAPSAVVPASSSPAGEVLDLSQPIAPVPAKSIGSAGGGAESAPISAPGNLSKPVATSRSDRRPGMTGAVIGTVVLVIAGGLMIWKPWASSPAQPEEPVTLAATSTLPRTEAFGSSTTGPAVPTEAGAPVGTAAVDSAPRGAADSAPSIIRVAAPRSMSAPLPTTNLLTGGNASALNINAGTLIQHYNAAYTEARSELELNMLQIGFTQIFLRSRLEKNAGVQETLRLLGSATNALRDYRGQESRIERAYSDTMGVAGRNLGWTPRDLGTWNAKPDQKENGETLRLTNLMLSQMDSVFSLLAAQKGKYQVSGEVITFESAEAARQYGALRVWLNQRADNYSGSSDALPATLRQVVKAIGSSRLPQEARR